MRAGVVFLSLLEFVRLEDRKVGGGLIKVG